VIDIVKELGEYNVVVDVYDPWINQEEAQHEYGIIPIASVEPGRYDAIVLAVAHRQFQELGTAGIRAFGKAEHVLYDLKYVLKPEESDLRL
jgi:UDP-N-acetyl-D-galactosamine dehydrogenase